MATKFLGELDAAAGGTGGVESFKDFILGRDGHVAQDVAFGFLDGDRNARVLGHVFLGHSPPFFKFFLANNLGEREFKVDNRRGFVGVGRQWFDDKLHGLLFAEFLDSSRFGLFADEKALRRQDLHRGEAEGRIHGVALFAVKVENKPLRGFIVALDFTEAPAPMDDVSTGLHGLELGFGRLE